MPELIQMTFDKVEKKIERTHTLSGKVIFAEDYSTKNSIPGVTIQLDSCPYKIRVLKGSIRGAGNAATLMGCIVSLTGVLKEYQGKSYFDPKDCEVTKQSGLAKIASAKVAFAGDLD